MIGLLMGCEDSKKLRDHEFEGTHSVIDLSESGSPKFSQLTGPLNRMVR
jgi:hypothetical protein